MGSRLEMGKNQLEYSCRGSFERNKTRFGNLSIG